MTTWLRTLAVLGVIVLLLPIHGYGRSSRQIQLVDRILAVVEGQVILLTDVQAFLYLGLLPRPEEPDPIPEALTALIERRLVLEEAARFPVDAPPASAVMSRMTQLVDGVGGDETATQVLAEVGYTVDDLRQVVLDNLRVERYLARRFPVGEPSSEAQYQARQQLIDNWVSSLLARAMVIRMSR